MRITDTSRIALLLDFENIVLGLHAGVKFRPKAITNRILEAGNIVIKRAYADWGRYDNHKVKLHELGFDLLEIPHRSMTGKNSADIRMVVDAMEVVISKETVDTFALVTGDSDFTPLVGKLREHGKRVIGVGVKDSSSKLLIESCDEFIFYDEITEPDMRRAPERLAAKSKGPKGGKVNDKDRRRAEALVMLLDAARGLLRRHDTVYSSMIKQTIMRKHPSFNESYHGYPSFSKMVEHAISLEILNATPDKDGNFRVLGIGERAQEV